MEEISHRTLANWNRDCEACGDRILQGDYISLQDDVWVHENCADDPAPLAENCVDTPPLD